MSENKKVCEDNPEHGEFELQEITMGGLCSSKWIGSCPCCVAERDEKESQKLDNQKEEYRQKKRLNAGISKRNLYKTFSDYDAEEGTPQYAAKMKFECLSNAIKDGSGFNVIASGLPGTGKTLLASALIESLIDRRRCKLVKNIDLIREMKETYRAKSRRTEKKIIEYYSNLPLLIIDEIGMQFDSNTEKIIIFDVIDGRYQNMLPTVLISNLDKEGITALIGERVIDRLREDGGELIVFDWDSKRNSSETE